MPIEMLFDMLSLLEKILQGEVIVDHLQLHMAGEDKSVSSRKHNKYLCTSAFKISYLPSPAHC